jgi:hypothetical protein
VCPASAHRRQVNSEQSTLASLLLRHGVLDESDDSHHDDAAYAPTCHIAKHPTSSSSSGAASASSPTQDSTEYLPSQTATDNTGDAIAKRSQAQILQKHTAEITPHGTKHKLNDQVHNVSSWLLAKCSRASMVPEPG